MLSEIKSGCAPQLQLSGKFHYKSAAQSDAPSKTHPLTRWNSPTGRIIARRTAPARQTDGRAIQKFAIMIYLIDHPQPDRTPSMLSDRPAPEGKQQSTAGNSIGNPCAVAMFLFLGTVMCCPWNDLL